MQNSDHRGLRGHGLFGGILLRHRTHDDNHQNLPYLMPHTRPEQHTTCYKKQAQGDLGL